MKIDFLKKVTFLSFTQKTSSKGNVYAMLTCFENNNTYNLFVPQELMEQFKDKKFGDVINLKLVAVLGKFPKVQVAGIVNKF